MKHILSAMLIALALFGHAQAADKKMERLMAYLKYYNSTSQIKIQLDRWYNISSFSLENDDLVALMKTLERENVNLVFEDPAYRGLGSYRYWTGTQTYDHYKNTVLVVNHSRGWRYFKTPRGGEAHTSHSTESISLEKQGDNGGHFLIPSDPALQQDRESISKYASEKYNKTKEVWQVTPNPDYEKVLNALKQYSAAAHNKPGISNSAKGKIMDRTKQLKSAQVRNKKRDSNQKREKRSARK